MTTRPARFLPIAAPLAAALLAATPAGAAKGDWARQGQMPLDFVKFLDAGEKKLFGVESEAMPVFSSRIESEAKFEVPRERLADVAAKLKSLAADPARVEALLGPGWKVQHEGNRKMVDVYLDNGSYALAQRGAGIRLRDAGGVVRLNAKPPGARVHRTNVVDRVEFGASIGRQADLGGLANHRGKVNPVRWLRTQMRSSNPAEFMKPAVKVTDHRETFTIYKKLPDGNWNPLIQMSVDDVSARGLRPEAGSRTARFGQLELDLNHIGVSGSQAQVTVGDRPWTPPHARAHLRTREYQQQVEVQDLNRIAPTLARHLGLRPGRPTLKYQAAAEGLGLIRPGKAAAPRVRPARPHAAPRAQRAVRPARPARVGRR